MDWLRVRILVGKVTEHLLNLIKKQIDDNGIVVWYDPEKVYPNFIRNLNLSGTPVLSFDGQLDKTGAWGAAAHPTRKTALLSERFCRGSLPGTSWPPARQSPVWYFRLDS